MMGSQNLNKFKLMEQEKADLISSHYKRLEEADKEKHMEVQRLKELQR